MEMTFYTVKIAIYIVDCIFQHVTLFRSKYSSSSNTQAPEPVSTISLLSVQA